MTALFSVFSYLIPPIVAPLVLLFRRKDYMALYHACQALSLVLGLVAVAVAWLVIGWLVAFLSVEVPTIYMIPIVIALAMPIWGMFKRSRRYVNRAIWWSIFWTTFLALAFSWACLKFVQWLSPNVLPIAGPFLQMASFAIVMAAIFVGAVGWVMGIVRSLRGIAKPVPIFGGWGQKWFAATTRRDREALAVEDAAAAADLLLREPTEPPLLPAAENATISDDPIIPPDALATDALATDVRNPDVVPPDSMAAKAGTQS